MANRLTVIKEDRLKKLSNLKEKGINPFPSKSTRKHTVAKAREMMDKAVHVAGRLLVIREHGKIAFADLADQTGKIQLLFRQDAIGDTINVLKLLDTGDYVEVEGNVTTTKAGETTIDVEKFQLLTKSIRPLPDSLAGFKDVEERFRQRYVDLLINPNVRKIFEIRAKVTKLLREYLDSRGFIEMKTPVLQPIYGGTTALPFMTHHNALDTDLYLRIADELYLKRLVVGGFEKVYEIGTDFRNEGIDRWHNPEFTQLEFYQAYADYNDLMKMTEEMLSEIVKEVTGDYEVSYGDTKINFKAPWKRVVYRDAIMDATGIDIDVVKTLEDLKKAVREKGIRIDYKDAPDVPAILDAIIKAHVRPKIIDPTFFIDYPYLMRPLAKRKSDDPEKAEVFQLVVAGTELINAYSELNDPIDQLARWQEDERRSKDGVTEHQVVDHDYIRALEYGMPPTAGWGMGIERFLAIITNSHSIKEVILFPTLRPEHKLANEKTSHRDA
jgi:lysyl-tRNA synthetase class 2